MLEKRVYPVLIKVTTCAYQPKVRHMFFMQKATSLEKAQKLVASYGAYHRTKRNLVSDENFSVVKKPARFYIKYTYNRLIPNKVGLRAIEAVLEALKTVAIERIYDAGAEGDICAKVVELAGDISVKSFIESYLHDRTKDTIIDYCVQACEFENLISPPCYLEATSFNSSLFD